MRQLGLPVVAGLVRDLLLGRELICLEEMVDRVAGGLQKPGEDVRRVVELGDLVERVDRLLLVIPRAVGGILVGQARGPGLVDGVIDEVVLVVIGELDGTDLAQPLSIRIEEAPQLLGRPGVRARRLPRAPGAR